MFAFLCFFLCRLSINRSNWFLIAIAFTYRRQYLAESALINQFYICPSNQYIFANTNAVCSYTKPLFVGIGLFHSQLICLSLFNDTDCSLESFELLSIACNKR